MYVLQLIACFYLWMTGVDSEFGIEAIIIKKNGVRVCEGGGTLKIESVLFVRVAGP